MIKKTYHSKNEPLQILVINLCVTIWQKVFLFLNEFCFIVFLFFCLFGILFRLWFLWPDETLRNKRCRHKCGCLGGCRFFGGTVTGLDFFRLEELTPSSSSAFSSMSAESDMYYGQSLLQPGEWIITKEIPKVVDGNEMC